MALPSVFKARGMFSRLWNPRRIPGVHTTAELEIAFARERARVERYANRFALIVLGPVQGEEGALESLARIVVARMRIPDVVGQLDHGRLAVILPETSSDGAWRFADNLFPRMVEAGLSCKCMVYVYPLERVPGDSFESLRRAAAFAGERTGRGGHEVIARDPSSVGRSRAHRAELSRHGNV